MARHAGHRTDFARTGGELARSLLREAGLKAVSVEAAALSDHYDPASRAVRMSQINFDGRSITAYAAAAHEVAHAIQDVEGYTPLRLRMRLARRPQPTGLLAMMVAPLAALLAIPIELDASFRRALPMLARGGHLSGPDLVAARQVLIAAALTYAAALGSSPSPARGLKLARTLRISAKVRSC
jgi:Zn-dependent membrane protease YugP